MNGFNPLALLIPILALALVAYPALWLVWNSCWRIGRRPVR